MLAAEKSVAVPHELMERMSGARRQSDALFNLVRENALYERPIPERHRIIFYLGHLEAFDWNQLGRDAAGLKPFHASFDRLFAFGIDPPAVDEVLGYNKRARQALDGVLDKTPEPMLHVAVEHRLMHAETFAYILHNAPPDRKTAPPSTPYP